MNWQNWANWAQTGQTGQTGHKLGTNWAHFNSMLLLITYTCNMHQITMVKGLGTQLAVTKFVE